jgi:hypothetical protein
MIDGETQSPGMQERVGVEQHQVSALGLLHSQVVGPSEAQIHLAANQANGHGGVGKLALHHLCRPVVGGVVQYQHLCA